MGVMKRANQKMGGDQNWIDKSELIRLRVPLAITDIDYDAVGSGKYPGANWIITVEPWDADKFPGPSGSFRMRNLPSRQGVFEDLSNQLEEQKAQNVGYIGPVAVISDIAKSGNRYMALADVKLDDQGEIVKDARGFAQIEGEQPEPPAAPPAAPAPQPGPRRPTQPAPAAAEAVGKLEQAAPQAPAAPAAAQASPTPDATPQPAPRRRGRPAAQPAPMPPGAPEAARYEQQAQAEAATEQIKPPATQPEAQPIPMAVVHCPHCDTDIGPNRVYPAQGGGFVIMHAHCPVKQDMVILQVEEVE